MLPLPDHLGALQVDLDGVRVEHHPLKLPLGLGHESVHLRVIKKPLKIISGENYFGFKMEMKLHPLCGVWSYMAQLSAPKSKVCFVD